MESVPGAPCRGSGLLPTEKTNTRTEDPTDPADIIALEGKERVDGVELSVAGNVTDQWQLFGGYAFMDSEIVESADPNRSGPSFPALRSRHSASGRRIGYRGTSKWAPARNSLTAV